jgi:hypothetical protein
VQQPAEQQPEPQVKGGKLAMRKRRAVDTSGRITRAKAAAEPQQPRGVGLDVPYDWGS